MITMMMELFCDMIRTTLFVVSNKSRRDTENGRNDTLTNAPDREKVNFKLTV